MFTDEELFEIRKAHPDLTDDQFATAMRIAEAYQLYPPPYSDQLTITLRSSSDGRGGFAKKLSVSPGISGLRTLADRTGKYAGSDVPEYEHDEKGYLIRAIVRVWRTDAPHPIGADAWYEEVVQRKRDGTPNRIWEQMPHLMTAKCAEASALRKAFPKELGRVYSSEEVEHGEGDVPTLAERPLPPATVATPAVPTPSPAAPRAVAAPAPVAPPPAPTPPQAPAPRPATPAAPAVTAPGLADRDRLRTLAGHLRDSAERFGVPRETLVALLGEWIGRPAAELREGRLRFAPDLTEGELERGVAGFKGWWREQRGATQTEPTPARGAAPPADPAPIPAGVTPEQLGLTPQECPF